MDSASTGVPLASRSSVASMIASSARALRGRPGALRSWSADAASAVVITPIILTDRLNFGQFQLLGEAFQRRLRGYQRLDLAARQPQQHHDHPDDPDQRR